MAAAAPRNYADFVPPHKLVEEADKKVLQIDLSASGFKKEQLRVQIDNHGMLRISGERQVSGNQLSRFHKEFHVPDDCNAGDVHARFDSKDGLLHITMPKLSPPEAAVAAAAAAEEPKAAAAATAKTSAGAGSKDQGAAAPAAPQQTGGAPDAEEKDQEDGGGDGEEAGDEPGTALVTGRRRKTPWSAILAVVLALVAAAGFYARYRLMDPSAKPAPADGVGHPFGLSDH